VKPRKQVGFIATDYRYSMGMLRNRFFELADAVGFLPIDPFFRPPSYLLVVSPLLTIDIH
jgi:hypothetical protein